MRRIAITLVLAALVLAGCGSAGHKSTATATTAGSSLLTLPDGPPPTARPGSQVNVYAADGPANLAAAVRGDPALVFVPHPIQDRTDDELKQLADDHLEAILALMISE